MLVHTDIQEDATTSATSVFPRLLFGILPTRTPHLHPAGQEMASVLAGTPNGPVVSLPTEKVESNVHFVVSSV